MSTAAYVVAPVDTGNTGKNIQTISRTVAGTLVHSHVVVPTDGRDILGVHYGNSGLLTIQAAAHAANEGFLYHINPIGSGVTISLRRISYQGAPVSTTARPATRITAERFTFTGTFSGSAITTGKRSTADAAAVGKFANNTAGLAVSPVGAVQRGFLIPAVPNGNGNTGSSNELVWEPINQDGETLIAPGEGIMFRQADAGSAGDDRTFLFNVTWAEY
jgi:hypothetical protein